MTTRYAVFWAPEPSHPLGDAGCTWLGRDPSQPQRQLPAREATAGPRRYGWRTRFDADTQRRLADKSLSPAQQELVRQWGYPHVLDRWRFHMTLSDSFEPDSAGGARRDRLLEEARRHFADALLQPLDCQLVCIYCQRAEGEPFWLSHRLALAP